MRRRLVTWLLAGALGLALLGVAASAPANEYESESAVGEQPTPSLYAKAFDLALARPLGLNGGNEFDSRRLHSIL